MEYKVWVGHRTIKLPTEIGYLLRRVPVKDEALYNIENVLNEKGEVTGFKFNFTKPKPLALTSMRTIKIKHNPKTRSYNLYIHSGVGAATFFGDKSYKKAYKITLKVDDDYIILITPKKPRMLADVFGKGMHVC